MHIKAVSTVALPTQTV